MKGQEIKVTKDGTERYFDFLTTACRSLDIKYNSVKNRKVWPFVYKGLIFERITIEK